MSYKSTSLINPDHGSSPANSVTIGVNTTQYLNFSPTAQDAELGIAFFLKGYIKGLVQTTVTLEYANDPQQTTWTALGAAENFGTPNANWVAAELAFRRSPSSGDFIPPFCRLKIMTGAASVAMLEKATKSYMGG